MAQVWTMYGLNPERMPGDPLPDTMSIFDDAGYTSVLGTDCDQTYARTLRPGEVPRSARPRGGRRPQGDRRRRGLVHHDEECLDRRRRGGRDDDVPRPQVQARHGRASVDKSKSARPMINRDTEFFWDGTAVGELRIQTCNACGELRHPPGPVCPVCHAMDRGYVVASGRGTVHSFLVPPRPCRPRQAAAAHVGAGRPRGGRPHDRRGRRRRGDRRCRRGLVRPDRRRGDAREVATRPAPSNPSRSLSQPRTYRSGSCRSPRRSWCRRHSPRATSRTCTTTATDRSGTAARTSSSTSSARPGSCSATSPTGPARRRRSCRARLRLGAPAHPYDTLRFTGDDRVGGRTG